MSHSMTRFKNNYRIIKIWHHWLIILNWRYIPFSYDRSNDRELSSIGSVNRSAEWLPMWSGNEILGIEIPGINIWLFFQDIPVTYGCRRSCRRWLMHNHALCVSRLHNFILKTLLELYTPILRSSVCGPQQSSILTILTLHV